MGKKGNNGELLAISKTGTIRSETEKYGGAGQYGGLIND